MTRPVAIDLQQINDWIARPPEKRWIYTSGSNTQMVFVQKLTEREVTFAFHRSWRTQETYRGHLDKNRRPSAYAVCLDLLTCQNPPPPFAFIDLFLEAMEADGDLSFHKYLEGRGP